VLHGKSNWKLVMNNPVDIKIAHINKADQFNNTLDKALVFEILSKTSHEL